MVQFIFIYCNEKIIINSNLNEKIKDICSLFSKKFHKNFSDFSFVLGDKYINEDLKELTFKQVIKNMDTDTGNEIINIYAYDITKGKDENILIKSKDIICPKCFESSKIIIKDYKINLSKCKYGHIINNLTFKEFEKSQYIDESKIICDNCKEVNKAFTPDNKFYKCTTCKQKLCPSCKKNHSEWHEVIDFYFKDSIREEHNERYCAFCNTCNKDICVFCVNKHKNNSHINGYYNIPKMNNIKNIFNEFKNKIENIYKGIDKDMNYLMNIIDSLKEIKENIQIYHNICENFIKNYDINNINFNKIENINNILNENIMKDFNKIINENNMNEKFKNILEIYMKLNKDKNNSSLKPEKLTNKPNESKIINANDKNYKETNKDTNNGNL